MEATSELEELDNKQKHLVALEAFIKSPAYRGYKSAVAQDIEDLKDSIVIVEPVDRSTEIENFKLRGELRCLQARLTLFEDARVTLKDRIDVLVERKLQNATNTKV